jgi:uncharacterized protein YkwD
MLSRARKRHFAACSVTCVAGVALVAASTAAAHIGGATPPIPLPLPGVGVPGVGGPATPVSGHCRGAGARSSRAAMRRALLCLVNQERARNGRGGFAANARLARAAGRHASDMARHNYFGHVSRRGSSPLARVRAAGWHGGVAEALAWGCGSLSTPRATVRAWMASAPHRAILLGGRRAAGVGVRRGHGCAGGRAFWVLDVG